MQIEICENSIECQNVQRLLKFLNLKHTIILYKSTKDLTKPEFQSKSLLNKVPLLEIKRGRYLNSYNGIVKYICSKSTFPLLGIEENDAFILDEYAEMISSIEDDLKNYEKSICNNLEQSVETLAKVKAGLSKLNKLLEFSAFLGRNQISFCDLLLFFLNEKSNLIIGSKEMTEFSHLKRLSKFIVESGF